MGGRSPGNSALPTSAFHFQTLKEGSPLAGRLALGVGGEWRREAASGGTVDACPPMTPLFTERLTQQEPLCYRVPAAL